ncbi:phosphonate ABC transporter, permease protein PhnE [Carnobacterium jeotgali]|uniref:phosphonate ABC transporter, permease protein PhnE n=1 Tax=Carnobacterium jeotgali TaxID=545534 RepID=UPI00388D3028
MSEMIETQFEQEPKKSLYLMSIITLLLIAFIWSVSSIEVQSLNVSGLTIASNIFKGLLNPDLNLLFGLTTSGVLYLLFETICIAFLGTIFGAVLAIPIAFLMAPSVVPAPLAYLVRLVVIAIRTVPALVYGLMFIRITGPGPFAGVLTMSITSIGMVSKLYVDIIEDLDTSILESLTSMGCTTFEKIRFGIIPQLFSNFLSVTIYRFDMNLRDATILGLVGAGGVGAPLIFAMNSYRWNEVGSILIGLIVLILLVEFFSNKMRANLVKG